LFTRTKRKYFTAVDRRNAFVFAVYGENDLQLDHF
jgi:hypothetical protein